MCVCKDLPILKAARGTDHLRNWAVNGFYFFSHFFSPGTFKKNKPITNNPNSPNKPTDNYISPQTRANVQSQLLWA